MCFDTESIQTYSDGGQDDVVDKTPVLDHEYHVTGEQTDTNKPFESHFKFPPIAQIEDFDLSDEDSF